MSMFKRAYTVMHGRDGFVLDVRDEWIPAIAAEWIGNGVLKALGHPCCDKGPLARVKVPYRWIWATGLSWGRVLDEEDWEDDPDENAMELFWWRVLQWPCKSHRWDRPLTSISLTDEQALTINPQVADWSFVWDDDEDDD